ncbi:MAG: TonB-dependent receptor [Planctomycetes bacterium]|nr:TonB-dependent receptor [Planctomycetota bacterium]
MTRRRLVAIAGFAVAFATPAASFAEEAAGAEAQDKTKEEEPQEVVVTATRIETPYEQVGSSVTVISRQEIERRRQTMVAELLRAVPGLDVVRTGTKGGETAVFIRGAKSDHTLVLIDGVEMNDPMSPGRSFDWAHLTTDNVERIEVIRGPQSTVYGSDAIGGVINIITRRGKGPPTVTLTSEAGSHYTFREGLSVLGATPLFNYAVAASRFDTKGISSAAREDGNFEHDGYRNTTFSAKLGFNPAENFAVDIIARCIDTWAELDNSFGVMDDPNYTARTRQHFLRAQGRLTLFDGLWEQRFGVSYTDHHRAYRNRPDPAHVGEFERGSFDGDILRFDWQHNLHLSETNTLTFGFETEEERGKSRYASQWGPSPFPEESARTNSFYVQDQFSIGDRFFAVVGARYDDHERFGSKWTYRAAPTYIIKETGTRLKASYGTGFKAPSLFQLYAPFFGNPNLQPEESKGWDLGAEQQLLGGLLTLDATYFRNKFKNLIDYSFVTSSYFNVGEAEAKGVELGATVRPCDNLFIRASYTHTDTEDKATGQKLLRRPEHKAALEANYRLLKRTNLNLSAAYVGRRKDIDARGWPATRVTLDDYLLVNLAVSHDINDNVQVFGRIENLLDAHYHEVTGYGALGIGFFVGLRATFGGSGKKP